MAANTRDVGMRPSSGLTLEFAREVTRFAGRQGDGSHANGKRRDYPEAADDEQSRA
jgi:hypothetical protein